MKVSICGIVWGPGCGGASMCGGGAVYDLVGEDDFDRWLSVFLSLRALGFLVMMWSVMAAVLRGGKGCKCEY